MKNTITFYGATWCGDCKRSKTYLDEHHIAYTDINIDKVEGAADKVKKMNNGLASIPTIIFPNGEILVEPTNKKLAETIAANKETLHL
jgi:mycoredoxin